MGQRESCGLVIFGRRVGNFDAYGLTDDEGKYLNHLFCKMKKLKCKPSPINSLSLDGDVAYKDLLEDLKKLIEN